MEIISRNGLHAYYYYYYYYCFTALFWALAAFSVYWSYTQSIWLLGRRISLSQGRYLHTEQHKHRINAHNTDIPALSGIWTPDPNVQTSKDSSCLRPRGHCDRLVCMYFSKCQVAAFIFFKFYYHRTFQHPMLFVGHSYRSHFRSWHAHHAVLLMENRELQRLGTSSDMIFIAVFKKNRHCLLRRTDKLIEIRYACLADK
jgi:hypothetical protein